MRLSPEELELEVMAHRYIYYVMNDEGISDYNKLVAANLDLEIKLRQLEIDKIRAGKWNGVSVSQYIPITAAGAIVTLPETK